MGNKTKLLSIPNKDLARLLASPKGSNNPVNVYARMYGGMASGRIKAHSNNLFPGKLYVVTIQAVTVPTANTIDATPSTKIRDDFT